MATKYIDMPEGAGAAAEYTGSHAGIGVDSATGLFYINPDGTRRQVAYEGTSPAVKTAAFSLVAADNGGTTFLNSATEFAVTLPVITTLPVGWRHSFVVMAAPSGASYTVVTAASGNIIKGHVLTSATGAADTETSGGDTISFVDGAAVAGDRGDVVFDGVTFHFQGACAAATGITITTAS